MLRYISLRLRPTRCISGKAEKQQNGQRVTKYQSASMILPHPTLSLLTTSASCSREMRAQGEMLRGEIESQESRQRAAIDELVEAIDVRTQVAELGEDVRWDVKKGQNQLYPENQVEIYNRYKLYPEN